MGKVEKKRRWIRWLGYFCLVLFVLSVWVVWEMRKVLPDEPNLYFAAGYKPPLLSDTKKIKPRCPSFQKGKKRVFWGDLHVHTSYSVDAFLNGTRNDPLDAYAFAQGKSLTLSDKKTKVKIDRPLDFMAVTDHAEYFSVFSACFHPKYRNLPICMAFRNLHQVHPYPRLLVTGVMGLRDMMATKDPKLPLVCSHKGVDCQSLLINTWKHVQAAAQTANKRCKFSTFVGYEWTATPGGSHMHRNVIFANAHVPKLAYDYVNYPTETKLWKALEKGCLKQNGCDVVTIPHNTNWSDGLSLQIRGVSKETLRLRAKYDRLVEIHQAKGNSECLNPYLDDKGDCNFEISLNPMSAALAKGVWFGLRPHPMTMKRWAKIRSSYVRPALLRGLKQYEKSKANPLQLGFVGSTDTHNGTPGAVSWKGFSGSHGDLDVNPSQRLRRTSSLNTNPGGLAAVWAEENTRESIFSALKRREAYATSGPRIVLRFFLLNQNVPNPCQKGQGHAVKVPMGGVFSDASWLRDLKPRFVVQALMDKNRLARIDIITASVKNGKVRSSVVNLPAEDKKRGDTSLCRVWTDRSFVRGEPTYWYARVLEVPTPRWSMRDCQKSGLCSKVPKRYKKNVQQRAWSSPIWYQP